MRSLSVVYETHSIGLVDDGLQAAAVIAWLVHTKIVYSDVTVDTSQNLPPTMVSLFNMPTTAIRCAFTWTTPLSQPRFETRTKVLPWQHFAAVVLFCRHGQAVNLGHGVFSRSRQCGR